MRFDSTLIHGGVRRDLPEGATALPIFYNTPYVYGDSDDWHSIRYPRLSTAPNQIALGEKFARLEGTESALVTSSGMAAITAALLSVVGPGEHLLAQSDLYGGTRGFLTQNFSGFGRQFTFFASNDEKEWRSLLTPNTRAIYVESVSNPLLRVANLRGIAAFAKEHGLVSLVDNTFLSPVNLRPAEMGFDLVLHSATKYLNGHSDLIAGVVSGSAARIAKCKQMLDHLGGCLDAHGCFLLDRGLKTLSLRMERHNTSALTLAQALEKNGRVAKVFYPGLPSHPDHATAREHFRAFGGMLALEMDARLAEQFLSRLTLAWKAPSLGGPETLVTQPAKTSHRALSSQEREALGISDGLIRISVGLEDVRDIAQDLSQALENT